MIWQRYIQGTPQECPAQTDFTVESDYCNISISNSSSCRSAGSSLSNGGGGGGSIKNI